MSKKKTTLLMAGGGTGGHLWPGISLAKAFMMLVPGSKVHFLVPGKPVDKSILATTDFPVYINPMRSLPSSPTQWGEFGIRFFQGWQKTIMAFQKCKPDVVVGLGGYGSLSSGILCHFYGIPFVMLESNRAAGKVVRWLARFAKAIYTLGEVEGIPAEKIKALGIPIRSDMPVQKIIEPHPEKKLTILVMGGSQGALCINRAVCEALPFLKDVACKLKFIHLCGQETEQIKETYQKHGITASVFPFYHKIGELYQEADMVVCRAGGSTLAEITAIGIPAILIPFEKAADNHQYKNALAMQRSGASSLLEERELSGEKLAAVMLSCIRNTGILFEMSKNTKAIGKPNAAQDIANDLIKLINEKSTCSMV